MKRASLPLLRSDGLHLRYRSTPMIVSKSFRAASVSAAEIFFASITFVLAAWSA
jgi:hypothetical protein